MPSTSSVGDHQSAGPSPAGTSQLSKSTNKLSIRRLSNYTKKTSQMNISFLPLPFVLFLFLSALLWPGNHGTLVSNREGEINSVRNELAVYDNEIISDPVISCGPGVVHFDVITKKGNASSVYVRGQSQNPDCTFHNIRNVTIELGKCNVRRKREINPNPGIAYQMTLVVQLHPLFVTKVDRAYNVNCFYREKPQDVSVDFGVNEIPTETVNSEPPLPACTYSVHRDSPNGPRVKYTHVGEQLYHVWECPSNMYSMLLYNCQAIDGKGAEYSIVDVNGCSKDEFLMPQITYTQDRTKAMAASAAFNFPDRNTMSFTCKIKLCMNTDLECTNVTPPNCNGKRAKSASNGNFNEDTSGESASNSTERTSTASMISSTWATIWGSGSSTEGRKVVSGEVIADVETESSTEAGTTTSSRPSTSTSTSTISSSTSTSTSVPSSSSTTPKSASITTEEQLLSSQERMSSASAEHSNSHGQQPSPQPSSWATSASEEQRPTLVTSSELPSDFPRPDLLLQKDQAMLVPPVKRGVGARMEKLDKLDESVDRADPSWTIMAEEEAKENKRRPPPEAESDDFNWSTKPVQIFDKRGEGKSARSQRDTTRGPPKHEKATVIRRKAGGHGMVDFDITSPELMIMDDYEPAAAAQKSGISTNNQRSSIQEAPFIDWTSDRRGNSTGNGVCLSAIALICAGILLMLLVLIVVFVLIRASRKSSGTVMEHSFYSN